MIYTLRFLSSKCSLFHNSNVFGSCIIHILYTGCAEIKQKYFRRQKVKANISNWISPTQTDTLTPIQATKSKFQSAFFRNVCFYENGEKPIMTISSLTIWYGMWPPISLPIWRRI